MTAVREGHDVDTDLFRRIFARHAAGVAVVTAQGDVPAGFTATSVVSVSADPPLLSFNLSRASSSWPVVSEASYVAVHLLAEDQSDVAALFARTGADRFGSGVSWHPGPFDVPLLDGVLAWAVCRLWSQVPAGDHAVVIGEVVRAHHADAIDPLVYHHGAFRGIAR